MRVEAIVQLDKRRSRVLTDEGLTFALYRGELKKYDLREGEELQSGFLHYQCQ